MKTNKKILTMMLVILLVVTTIIFSGQAGLIKITSSLEGKAISHVESNSTVNGSIHDVPVKPVPRYRLSIQAPSEVIEGESFQVTVTANNHSVSGANIVFNDEIKQTDAYGQVTFIAPEVDQTTNFTIFAFKYGYLNGTTPIMVIDQPETIDIEPPVVVIEYPKDGAIFTYPNITVIGHATDNVGIVFGSINHEWNGGGVGGGGYFPEALLNWSFDFEIELRPGYNIISVYAKDAAENSGSDSININLGEITIIYVDDDADPSLNIPPIADASKDQVVGVNMMPLTNERTKKTNVTLDGSHSYDPDGYIVNWTWKYTDSHFGETILGYGEKLEIEVGASIQVILTVTDNRGAKSQDTMNITVVYLF